MKYWILSFLVLLCARQKTIAQNFITQWNLATTGSGPTQLSFGTATSGIVSYTWQEISPGSASGSGTWSGATLAFTGLPAGATIRLEIAPTNFQRIIINNGSDRRRLVQVEQWGSVAWTSMQNAFRGCANLHVTATDVPDLSGVSDMSGMFSSCNNLNSPGNIGSWITSTVTNMSGMFSLASAFNQNINSWNTGAVTNMSGLFADAAAFNQDIGAWNTASVTNMANMFGGAIAFNRNIGAWNTSAVTNMNSMFFSAYRFNQNISGWNTAAVTNMSSMFGYAYDFNQNIGTWNTSAVINMGRMFEDAFDFNQNIGTWNTAAVTNMSGMFIDAYAFNQNIGTWNTGAVTNMDRMFDFATAFNQNIGTWNTAAVTDMRGMFADAEDFNQNIGTWTLNPAVNLSNMLNNSGMDCSNYSATLIGWNANPATPNGRTLGAIGRQYGTNAAAARTNLISTKLWTITGDTPSGTVCSSIPTITSFAPANGPIGTTVTITGTNFSSTSANNIVYFGATRATVTSATPTQLTVSVPLGATYQPISVLVNGLTGYSSKPFVVTFADGGIIDACSFAAKVDVTTGSEPYSIAIGDLDSDGKPDLAVANQISNTISVFKNISILGSITAGSFAAKVDFITNSEPYYVGIHDLDGDGKPELIVSNNDSDNVSIYKNTTTTGVINVSSFAAKVDFATEENPWNVAIDDFDLDGKPDLAVVNDVSNSVSVLKNQTTPGSITASSFAPAVNFATGAFPIGIDSKDLDGDGKSDLVVTNQSDNSISILRNTSTVGSITATSFAAKVDLATGLDPYSVSIGDLNDNGKPDVVVANFSSGSLSVFDNISNSGSIDFLTKVDFTSGAGALDVKLSDIDGDGKPDAVVTNGGSRISILKNANSSTPIAIGSLSFPIDFTSTSDPYGVAIGDLDGNGKPDIAATNYNGSTVSILRNTVSSLPMFTSSSFTPTSGPVGTVVTFTGTNFSSTPLNNTITFNGVPAIVTASSSTSITATVPVGTTTGPIAIEIGCVKAFSIFPFTVTGGNTITITQQPGFTYVCEGSAATFSADATGTTNIIYKWQKYDGSDFADINDGGGYTGTTTKNLSINTVATGFSGNGEYRCRINGDLASEVFTNSAQLTINGIPSPPDVTSGDSCGPGSVTLTASGGSPGDYQWYTTSPLTLINGETNETYTTPVLSASTQYAVTVKDIFCKSLPANVTALVNPIPAKTLITSSAIAVGNAITICSTTALTLSAPVGFTNYLWSDGSITQQISVSVAGTYSVVVTDTQGCTSPASDILTVTIVPAPCTNSAPVINPTSVTTTIGGQTSINLLDLISDADDNLVLSSLIVIVQPTSGAPTTITNGILLIDYTGINFTGTDELTIQVCDVFGECTQQVIEVGVIGDIEIYNAVSPNNDGLNDIFYIEYINLIPETQNNTVSIFNRWGSKVFEVEDYNNNDKVFKGLNENGNELPSGTYFYKIAFDSGKKQISGYLALKR
jgi:gliding motility-associated-like protein